MGCGGEFGLGVGDVFGCGDEVFGMGEAGTDAFDGSGEDFRGGVVGISVCGGDDKMGAKGLGEGGGATGGAA